MPTSNLDGLAGPQGRLLVGERDDVLDGLILRRSYFGEHGGDRIALEAQKDRKADAVYGEGQPSLS